jgi:hypothetical protein
MPRPGGTPRLHSHETSWREQARPRGTLNSSSRNCAYHSACAESIQQFPFISGWLTPCFVRSLKTTKKTRMKKKDAEEEDKGEGYSE